MIGYNRIHHKRLDCVWKVFEELDGENTPVFYKTLYSVIWNMLGTYFIFSKMWDQTPKDLERFLERFCLHWLWRWLYAKDK